jgi:hypothetical protein
MKSRLWLLYAILQYLKSFEYTSRHFSTYRISTFSASLNSGIQEVGKSGHFPVRDENFVKKTARLIELALRQQFESGLLISGDPYWTVVIYRLRNDHWMWWGKGVASYFKILDEIRSEEMRNYENSSSWTTLDENDTNYTLQYFVPEVVFGKKKYVP